MGLFDKLPARQALRAAREVLAGTSEQATPAPPVVTEPSWTRPTPPEEANNYIIVILDSCRYDSFMKAKPKLITKLGDVEKRYSYATWTAPSHYNLLMGLLPHSSPPHVYARDHVRSNFWKIYRFNTIQFLYTVQCSNLKLCSKLLPTFKQRCVKL